MIFFLFFSGLDDPREPWSTAWLRVRAGGVGTTKTTEYCTKQSILVNNKSDRDDTANHSTPWLSTTPGEWTQESVSIPSRQLSPVSIQRRQCNKHKARIDIVPIIALWPLHQLRTFLVFVPYSLAYFSCIACISCIKNMQVPCIGWKLGFTQMTDGKKCTTTHWLATVITYVQAWTQPAHARYKNTEHESRLAQWPNAVVGLSTVISNKHELM